MKMNKMLQKIDIQLNHPPKSYSYKTYKVFWPLVCCLKGMWVHPYTATLTKPPLDP